MFVYKELTYDASQTHCINAALPFHVKSVIEIIRSPTAPPLPNHLGRAQKHQIPLRHDSQLTTCAYDGVTSLIQPRSFPSIQIADLNQILTITFPGPVNKRRPADCGLHLQGDISSKLTGGRRGAARRFARRVHEQSVVHQSITNLYPKVKPTRDPNSQCLGTR